MKFTSIFFTASAEHFFFILTYASAYRKLRPRLP